MSVFYGTKKDSALLQPDNPAPPYPNTNNIPYGSFYNNPAPEPVTSRIAGGHPSPTHPLT